MTLPSGNMHIGDLYEMSNFSPKTTGLSPGIAVWCRTDLTDHGHNRYMVKIRKKWRVGRHIYCGIIAVNG